MFQFPPQLFQDVVEVGEGDGAADVQHDRVLLPLGALEVLQLAKDGRVFNASDLRSQEEKKYWRICRKSADCLKEVIFFFAVK